MRFLSFDAQAYSVKACAKVFDKAKESIKIIIPDTHINFFWDSQVIKALRRAVERGVAVKIAHCEMYNVGKIGIFSVPGVEILKLRKSYERLLISVDAKHAIIGHSSREIRKIEVGIISSNVSLLAHEYDTIFDELVVK